MGYDNNILGQEFRRWLNDPDKYYTLTPINSIEEPEAMPITEEVYDDRGFFEKFFEPDPVEVNKNANLLKQGMAAAQNEGLGYGSLRFNYANPNDFTLERVGRGLVTGDLIQEGSDIYRVREKDGKRVPEVVPIAAFTDKGNVQIYKYSGHTGKTFERLTKEISREDYKKDRNNDGFDAFMTKGFGKSITQPIYALPRLWDWDARHTSSDFKMNDGTNRFQTEQMVGAIAGELTKAVAPIGIAGKLNLVKGPWTAAMAMSAATEAPRALEDYMNEDITGRGALARVVGNTALNAAGIMSGAKSSQEIAKLLDAGSKLRAVGEVGKEIGKQTVLASLSAVPEVYGEQAHNKAISNEYKKLGLTSLQQEKSFWEEFGTQMGTMGAVNVVSEILGFGKLGFGKVKEHVRWNYERFATPAEKKIITYMDQVRDNIKTDKDITNAMAEARKLKVVKDTFGERALKAKLQATLEDPFVTTNRIYKMLADGETPGNIVSYLNKQDIGILPTDKIALETQVNKMSEFHKQMTSDYSEPVRIEVVSNDGQVDVVLSPLTKPVSEPTVIENINSSSMMGDEHSHLRERYGTIATGKGISGTERQNFGSYLETVAKNVENKPFQAFLNQFKNTETGKLNYYSERVLKNILDVYTYITGDTPAHKSIVDIIDVVANHANGTVRPYYFETNPSKYIDKEVTALLPDALVKHLAASDRRYLIKQLLYNLRETRHSNENIHKMLQDVFGFKGKPDPQSDTYYEETIAKMLSEKRVDYTQLDGLIKAVEIMANINEKAGVIPIEADVESKALESVNRETPITDEQPIEPMDVSQPMDIVSPELSRFANQQNEEANINAQYNQARILQPDVLQSDDISAWVDEQMMGYRPGDIVAYNGKAGIYVDESPNGNHYIDTDLNSEGGVIEVPASDFEVIRINTDYRPASEPSTVVAGEPPVQDINTDAPIQDNGITTTSVDDSSAMLQTPDPVNPEQTDVQKPVTEQDIDVPVENIKPVEQNTGENIQLSEVNEPAKVIPDNESSGAGKPSITARAVKTKSTITAKQIAKEQAKRQELIKNIAEEKENIERLEANIEERTKEYKSQDNGYAEEINELREQVAQLRQGKDTFTKEEKLAIRQLLDQIQDVTEQRKDSWSSWKDYDLPDLKDDIKESQKKIKKYERELNKYPDKDFAANAVDAEPTPPNKIPPIGKESSGVKLIDNEKPPKTAEFEAKAAKPTKLSKTAKKLNSEAEIAKNDNLKTNVEPQKRKTKKIRKDAIEVVPEEIKVVEEPVTDTRKPVVEIIDEPEDIFIERTEPTKPITEQQVDDDLSLYVQDKSTELTKNQKEIEKLQRKITTLEKKISKAANKVEIREEIDSAKSQMKSLQTTSKIKSENISRIEAANRIYRAIGKTFENDQILVTVKDKWIEIKAKVKMADALNSIKEQFGLDEASIKTLVDSVNNGSKISKTFAYVPQMPKGKTADVKLEIEKNLMRSATGAGMLLADSQIEDDDPLSMLKGTLNVLGTGLILSDGFKYIRSAKSEKINAMLSKPVVADFLAKHKFEKYFVRDIPVDSKTQKRYFNDISSKMSEQERAIAKEKYYQYEKQANTLKQSSWKLSRSLNHAKGPYWEKLKSKALQGKLEGNKAMQEIQNSRDIFEKSLPKIDGLKQSEVRSKLIQVNDKLYTEATRIINEPSYSKDTRIAKLNELNSEANIKRNIQEMFGTDYVDSLDDSYNKLRETANLLTRHEAKTETLDKYNFDIEANAKERADMQAKSDALVQAMKDAKASIKTRKTEIRSDVDYKELMKTKGKKYREIVKDKKLAKAKIDKDVDLISLQSQYNVAKSELKLINNRLKAIEYAEEFAEMSGKIHHMPSRWSAIRQDATHAASFYEIDGSGKRMHENYSRMNHMQYFSNSDDRVKFVNNWLSEHNAKPLDTPELPNVWKATVNGQDILVKINDKIDVLASNQYNSTGMNQIRNSILRLARNEADYNISKVAFLKELNTIKQSAEGATNDGNEVGQINVNEVIDDLIARLEESPDRTIQSSVLKDMLKYTVQPKAKRILRNKNTVGYADATTDWNKLWDIGFERVANKVQNKYMAVRLRDEVEGQLLEMKSLGINNDYTQYVQDVYDDLNYTPASDNQKSNIVSPKAKRYIHLIEHIATGGVLMANPVSAMKNLEGGFYTTLSSLISDHGWDKTLSILGSMTKGVKGVKDFYKNLETTHYGKDNILNDIHAKILSEGIAKQTSITGFEDAGLVSSKLRNIRDKGYALLTITEMFNRYMTAMAYADMYVKANPLDPRQDRSAYVDLLANQASSMAGSTQGLFDYVFRTSTEKALLRKVPMGKSFLTLVSPAINQLAFFANLGKSALYAEGTAKRKAISGLLAMALFGTVIGGVEFIPGVGDLVAANDLIKDGDQKTIHSAMEGIRSAMRAEGFADKDITFITNTIQKGLLSAMSDIDLSMQSTAYELLIPYLAQVAYQTVAKDLPKMYKDGLPDGLEAMLKRRFVAPGRLYQAAKQYNKGQYLDSKGNVLGRKFDEFDFVKTAVTGNSLTDRLANENEIFLDDNLTTPQGKRKFTKQLFSDNIILGKMPSERKQALLNAIITDQSIINKAEKIYDDIRKVKQRPSMQQSADRNKKKLDKFLEKHQPALEKAYSKLEYTGKNPDIENNLNTIKNAIDKYNNVAAKVEVIAPYFRKAGYNSPVLNSFDVDKNNDLSEYIAGGQHLSQYPPSERAYWYAVLQYYEILSKL